MNPVLICLVIGVVILLVIFLAAAIKIVPEYKRLVVFRLGRCIGPKGPGLTLLIPFIDRPVSVDLREQVREIPTQASITQDNAPVSIDFLWYYKVFDPVQSVLQVQNFELAAQGMPPPLYVLSSAVSCWMVFFLNVKRSTPPCVPVWMKLPSAGV